MKPRKGRVTAYWASDFTRCPLRNLAAIHCDLALKPPGTSHSTAHGRPHADDPWWHSAPHRPLPIARGSLSPGQESHAAAWASGIRRAKRTRTCARSQSHCCCADGLSPARAKSAKWCENRKLSQRKINTSDGWQWCATIRIHALWNQILHE